MISTLHHPYFIIGNVEETPKEIERTQNDEIMFGNLKKTHLIQYC